MRPGAGDAGGGRRPGGETRGGFLPRACSSRSARSYSAEASPYWPLRKFWLPAARSCSTDSETLGAIPGRAGKQRPTPFPPTRCVTASGRKQPLRAFKAGGCLVSRGGARRVGASGRWGGQAEAWAQALSSGLSLFSGVGLGGAGPRGS